MTFLGIILLLGLIVVIQNRVYRARALEDLDYHCTVDRHELFENETFTVTEELTNRKGLLLPWLKSELTTSAGLEFAKSQEILADQTRFVPSFFMLRAHEKVARHWNVTAVAFGVHQVAKTVLVASDLLGFVTVSKAVPINHTVTVLPRPFDLEPIDVELRADLGELVVKRRLLADPFFKAGVRPYQPTDDLKQVHWYATARENALMVYEQEATLNQSLAVVLNMQTRSRIFDKGDDVRALRTMVRVASTVIDQTIRSGLPVRLIANSSHTSGMTQTPTAAGREHAHGLMRTLATIPMRVTQSAETFFTHLNLHELDMTDLVLVTHYVDDVITQFMQKVRDHGATVKLVLTGPPPSDLDLPSGVTLVPLYRHLHRLSHPGRSHA